jgi:hypothetical protein
MTTDSQNIQTANDITRRGLSTPPTTIDAPVFVPFPAYGTRLRGPMFVNLHSATGFIVQLGHQSGITGTTDLLRLTPSQMLCRIVKRLANITCRTREGVRHLAGGFMHQIAQAPMRLAEHLSLAALQALPTARALRLGALGLLARSKALVAILHGGLGRAPTDQNGLLTIRGSKQGIDAQIYADDRLLRPWDIGHITDQSNTAHTEPNFYQPSRHRDRDRNTQPPTGAMGEVESPMLDARALIRIDDIAIAGLPPGIARIFMAIAAQLTCAMDGFAEFANDVLHALRMQPGIAALRPAFPALFAGPLQVAVPYPVMAFHHVAPQPSSLAPCRRKGAPFRRGMWHPVNFCRAVTHA